MNDQTSNSPSPRLLSLDGWRGISIILVLISHCRETEGFPPSLDPFFKWMLDGSLGVRMFFLISGFLITWLMLKEQDQAGRLSLPHFYARRALRILPVYLVFLGVLALLQIFTPYYQTPAAWIRNLTFTTNYFDLGGGASWTSGHLWSLAVEEQFYLLWPVAFVFFGLANRLRVSLFILALSLVATPLFRVVTHLKIAPDFLKPLFSQYSFLNCFDSLAIGCGCAILFVRKREWLNGWERRWRNLIMPVCLLLIVVPHVLSKLPGYGIFTIPVGGIFQEIGLAALLIQSLILPQHGFFRWLNRPLICHIGVLSYSIYIWQQIFCTKPAVFGQTQVWWMSFPGWLLPVFAVAHISYYGLERPLFRMRDRFRTDKKDKNS